MQINVAQLLQDPVGTTRDYKVSEVVDITGDGNGRLVQGEVKLLRTPRSILVKSRLRTETELTCSRCLGPFSALLALKIEEGYLPTVDVVSGAPLPPPEEASSFTIDEHHVIDLTEAIRQYVLLAIPIKSLCREDCAGLCHNCGHNLNRGSCGCPAQEIDPRWAELVKLIESGK